LRRWLTCIELFLKKLVVGGWRIARVQSQTVQYGLTLLTLNSKDFVDIPGLELVVL
jgi:hypothetical protein